MGCISCLSKGSDQLLGKGIEPARLLNKDSPVPRENVDPALILAPLYFRMPLFPEIE